MRKSSWLIAISFLCVSCAPELPLKPKVPSIDYAARVKMQDAEDHPGGYRKSTAPPLVSEPNIHNREIDELGTNQDRAQLHFVADSEPTADTALPSDAEPLAEADIVTNMGPGGDTEIIRSSAPLVRDYNGPLSLGDPGVSASLYQESRRSNDLFRDERAWQPLDLVTILITEDSEGSKEADTEVTSESNILMSLVNLFGWEKDILEKNPDLDDGAGNLKDLVNASSTNDYKGEGETTRKGSLKASISAMVVEVLPGGVLRIEGEKIVAVNQEEQVIVISGLARPRDINSNNEVESAKVANLRIDYYGRGTVGEAQYGGWGARMLRRIWPF